MASSSALSRRAFGRLIGRGMAAATLPPLFAAGEAGARAPAAPTFEAIGVHARVHGAEIVTVPLDGQYAHDLDKMTVDGAGLVYLCNPNNPTGSITPKARVRAFLDAIPSSATVLVDEAYHHYADSPDYESVVPLVATQPNLILIDVRKEVKPVIEALRERRVLVGRLFPALPRHLRVTIGTPAQMKRFLEAFAAVVV